METLLRILGNFFPSRSDEQHIRSVVSRQCFRQKLSENRQESVQVIVCTFDTI